MSLPSMLRQQDASEGAAAKAAGPGQPLTAGGLEPLAEEEGDEEAAAVAPDIGQPLPPSSPLHLPPRPPQSRAAAPPAANGHALGGGSGGGGGGDDGPGWVWRTQLEQSAPYWEGWYTGLSDMFLALPVPKVRVG